MKNIAIYATVYDPLDGIAHCCIHYLDGSCRYGAMEVKSVIRIGCVVFDITHTNVILGLNMDNILEHGGVIVSHLSYESFKNKIL